MPMFNPCSPCCSPGSVYILGSSAVAGLARLSALYVAAGYTVGTGTSFSAFFSDPNVNSYKLLIIADYGDATYASQLDAWLAIGNKRIFWMAAPTAGFPNVPVPGNRVFINATIAALGLSL